MINKADFLSEKQRKLWAEYFDSINLSVAFFSALQENQNNLMRNLKIDEAEEEDEENEEYEEDEEVEEDEGEEDETSDLESVEGEELSNIADSYESKEPKAESVHSDRKVSFANISDDTACASSSKNQERNSTRLLSRDELIQLFKTIHNGIKVQEGRTVVGLVGYPNVGKSSTLNSLLTFKKVSVSATPGKTKHFQVNCDKQVTKCL